MFTQNSVESYIKNWDEMHMYYQDDGTLKCRSKEPCPLDLEFASQLHSRYDIYSDLNSISDVMPFCIDDVSEEFETRNFTNSSIYRTQNDYSDYYKFYFQKGYVASCYDHVLRKVMPDPGFDGKKTLFNASKNASRLRF